MREIGGISGEEVERRLEGARATSPETHGLHGSVATVDTK